MSELWVVPAFFLAKCLVYTGYCRGGLGWLKGSTEQPWPRAFGFALLRMGIGVVLGVAFLRCFSLFHVRGNLLGIPEWFGSWVWAYVICYGLLRFLIWSMIAYWVSGRNVTIEPSRHVVGIRRRSAVLFDRCHRLCRGDHSHRPNLLAPPGAWHRAQNPHLSARKGVPPFPYTNRRRHVKQQYLGMRNSPIYLDE